ncbi:heterokaryon incompatibility protein-domain-containing protein [Cladorrhinum sp. PSN259]|nr:heterokaryon incompatibility protein-domain-containing protein [Cladorrhinum sp. PSN259]
MAVPGSRLLSNEQQPNDGNSVHEPVPYQYIPLQDPAKDIRIIKLHPGHGEVPLKLEIIHTALLRNSGEAIGTSHSEIATIRTTLPDGWGVEQTVDGRLIYIHSFRHEGVRSRVTSWVHPVNPDLYPSSPEDSNLGSFGKSNSADNPDYEALSYTWGERSEQEMVLVQNTNPAEMTVDQTWHWQHFEISKRLAEALRHLRRSDDPRSLWVDAICINQDDVVERNAQVQRMGSIFAQARRVVAWVGPSFEGAQDALKTLEYIGSQVQYLSNKVLVSNPGCAHPDWRRTRVKLPYNNDTLLSIDRLLHAPWFERMWVVQEMVLGSPMTVIKCGETEVLWSVFRRGVVVLLNKDSRSRPDVTHSSTLCSYKPTKLDELLFKYHDRPCSDDRDRIYALLHIAPPKLAQEITVDYTLPASEVYKSTTITYINVTQRLEILRHTPRKVRDKECAPNRPSWVPNWSKAIALRRSPGRGFCAGGFSCARSCYKAPNRLDITGVMVGSVGSCEMMGFSSFADIVDFLKCRKIEELQNSLYYTGETNLRAHLLTLMENGIAEAEVRSMLNLPVYRKLSEEIIRVASDGGRVSEDVLTNQTTSRLVKSCKQAYTFVLGTDSNHLGKSRAPAKEGDVVFVPLGCETPLLLRPNQTGQYQLISECYVHGIMFGESILGPLPAPWSGAKCPGPAGSTRTCFYNPDGRYELEDPRLEDIPLPGEWEQIRSAQEETTDDPRTFVGEFRHRETGETINGDPRLLPKALIARGVSLTTVTLV